MLPYYSRNRLGNPLLWRNTTSLHLCVQQGAQLTAMSSISGSTQSGGGGRPAMAPASLWGSGGAQWSLPGCENSSLLVTAEVQMLLTGAEAHQAVSPWSGHLGLVAHAHQHSGWYQAPTPQPCRA